MEIIKFVDIGEGITEGRIQKWLVKDGDTVKEDQAVAQVETDKAVASIPAPASGIIKIVAKEGSDIKVGGVMAYLGSKDEISKAGTGEDVPLANAKSDKTIKPQQSPVQNKQAVSEDHDKRVIAPPSVRHMAEELGIDIGNVKGSGPNGRITLDDVKNYSTKKPTDSQKGAVAAASSADNADIERLPLSPTRKAMAKNMELSWQMPTASHIDLINANALFGVVQKEKEKTLKRLNVKLSYLPFIIKAAVEALKENPNFNASYDREKQEIIVKKHYNIGIAAEAPDGLKVVVIKDSDKKSIVELAKELDELHKKALDRTISLSEMKDSSFTITNVGSLGGGFIAIPVINYPDVAILGITLIRDMPVVDEDKIVPGKVLPFTVTFDHRVVDGAEAVKFGNAFKSYMEDPEFLDML